MDSSPGHGLSFSKPCAAAQPLQTCLFPRWLPRGSSPAGSCWEGDAQYNACKYFLRKKSSFQGREQRTLCPSLPLLWAYSCLFHVTFSIFLQCDCPVATSLSPHLLLCRNVGQHQDVLAASLVSAYLSASLPWWGNTEA